MKVVEVLDGELLALDGLSGLALPDRGAATLRALHERRAARALEGRGYQGKRMKGEAVSVAQDRTDAKLRYAKLMLDELRGYHGGQGDDFERSHEEAVLFHLHGVRDALLNEINVQYACGLEPDEVRINRLKKKLLPMNGVCPELTEIIRRESDPSDILYRIRNWRDISAHRSGVTRTYYVGGETHGQRRFSDPVSGSPSDRDILVEFADAIAEMRELVVWVRASMAGDQR